jgi:hypothetical protein
MGRKVQVSAMEHARGKCAYLDARRCVICFEIALGFPLYCSGRSAAVAVAVSFSRTTPL